MKIKEENSQFDNYAGPQLCSVEAAAHHAITRLRLEPGRLWRHDKACISDVHKLI